MTEMLVIYMLQSLVLGPAWRHSCETHPVMFSSFFEKEIGLNIIRSSLKENMFNE